jgi:benzoyl-CoA reductase/2-hydroxyglutaryl-CoA dehydratase subunit BcrC/BadD/HgdB
MVAEPKGLERMIEEIGLIELFVKDQQDNPEEFSDLVIPLARFHQEDNKRTVQCVERGEPFLASWYACAPEIYTAMDLHWYCISSGAFGTGGIEGPHFLEDLEALDSLPVPTDICTLLRLTLHWVEARMLPIPTASIAAIAPCDGIAGLHETIREHGDWRDVPMFGPDAPYFEDERSLDYFASELRRMAAFIEEHTGRKLEMNRLREVVEESNRQYELWQEHNELRRSVPCPHGAMLAMGAFAVAQGTLCGRPEGTAWLRELVADAERRIAEKRPAVPDEKVRLLWYDLHPVWFGELIEWLEQEWGACTIQTFLTQFPYTRVDTSSEESIWRGLAKRNLEDAPMIRQARGTIDIFAKDLVRLVRDFKIDCAIWPGHMGHKDGAAAIPVMKETCRELGVPFLHIGLDQYDRRYTPIDDIKNRIDQFFTAMGVG